MKKSEIVDLINHMNDIRCHNDISLGNKIHALDERVSNLEERVTDIDPMRNMPESAGEAPIFDTEAPKPKPRGPMLEAPEDGTQCFHIYSDGKIDRRLWDCDLEIPKFRLAQGNCFHTKEDAERESQARELHQKIREWIARDGWEADWSDAGQVKAELFYNPIYNAAWNYKTVWIARTPGSIYFNPDDFDALIEKFGPRLEVLL